MGWKLADDTTEPVITAKKHIASAHGNPDACKLPQTCVIFELGMAISFVESQYSTYTISEHIPGFITDEKCIGITGNDRVCFTRGGYGAPAAVDTLETVLALGVKNIIIVGMCGGFSADVHVGDVIVPQKILSEEGTSRHYSGDIDYAFPDDWLHGKLTDHFAQCFHVLTSPSVSSDAVYRQTMAKEEYWRKQGCIAVDMEASALLSACRFYSIPAAAVLLCSDRHPLPGECKNWNWGNENFGEKRRHFIEHVVSFALQNY